MYLYSLYACVKVDCPTCSDLLTVTSYVYSCCLCCCVADYLKRFATEEAVGELDNMSSSSESSMSDFSEDEAQDMEL